MATVADAKGHAPEDLLAITDRPMPELIDGQLVERPPMGQESDLLAATLLALVWNHARQHRLGRVNGAQGSYQIFPDEPQKVRIPDVSFTREERWPATGPARGHSRVAPDLVIEVVSPHDIVADLEEKVEDFLRAGVPLIWVVSPETRTIQVHRQGGTDTRLRVGDTLDGEEVLPGFRCDLARLFEGL